MTAPNKAGRAANAAARLRMPALALLLLFLLLALLPLLPARTARASYAGYTYTNYAVTATYREGRTFRVEERIDVYYETGGGHGIYRTLPVNSGERYAAIEGDVADIETDDGFLTVYLGDESDFIYAGDARSYTFSYDFELPVGSERDSFQFNILGTGMEAPSERFVGRMIVPFKPTNATVYAGSYGDTDGSPLAWTQTEDGYELYYEAEDVSPYSGVTFAVDFAAGTLPGTSLSAAEIGMIAAAAAVAALAVLLALLLPRGRVVPVVNFSPPANMDPLQMGYRIDLKASNEDVTSLLFYLADKGHISIDMENEKDPKFVRRDPLPESAPHYLKTFYADLFKGRDEVRADDLRYKFYKTTEFVRGAVSRENKTFFRSANTAVALALAIAAGLLGLIAPLVASLAAGLGVSFFDLLLRGAPMALAAAVCYAVGHTAIRHSVKWGTGKTAAYALLALPVAAAGAIIFCFAVPAFLMGTTAKAALCACLAAAMIAAPWCNRRKADYLRELGEIAGFASFIRLAEKDRLEAMLAEDPAFYYHILPYAQVLGISDIWEDKFRDLAVQPPAWLTHYPSAYNILIFHSFYRRTSSMMAQSMSVHPSSKGHGGLSGGGFGGGGGFSGGGFGGGGGGRW